MNKHSKPASSQTASSKTATSKTADVDVAGRLVEASLETPEGELTCDEWVQQVGRYVEAMANDGKTPAALDLIAQHAAACPQCAEEFRALRTALGLTG